MNQPRSNKNQAEPICIYVSGAHLHSFLRYGSAPEQTDEKGNHQTWSSAEIIYSLLP